MNQGPLTPFMVARYGVYAAVAVAAGSAWLGYRAGASLDYVLLRSVFIFVIVTALGFGAEAVLNVPTLPTAGGQQPARPAAEPEQTDD